ncbi:MAG: type II secretion system protein [Verrucomicrobia bacterium]|nr:type II secretion system protein [Verrucomicrobiota bacterium]
MKRFAHQRLRGFTEVEIMIVISLVGLVAAIAVPNFMRARSLSRRNACIANLRRIENAKQVWARESLRSATDTPAESDLFGSSKYLRQPPRCPSGGFYMLNPVDTPAQCSLGPIEGHNL